MERLWDFKEYISYNYKNNKSIIKISLSVKGKLSSIFMISKNYYSYRKHYVFVFYKNGKYRVFKFSGSSNKKVSERRKKFFDFLPYDKTIKKFYVITGIDQTKGFSQKLCRELNNELINS